MRKCDTCVGHEARINKLLLKKPPGIPSTDNTSSVCEQCANEPSTASEKRREKERNVRQKVYIKMERGRRRTHSPALGIESSETGCVPWVRLESVIRRIS